MVEKNNRLVEKFKKGIKKQVGLVDSPVSDLNNKL